MAFLDRIDFSVATEEYYRANAVCEVVTHEIFKKGLIVEGGPCDLRMGAFGRQSCRTCHRLLECHGHFGIIELAAPIYNITYQNKIKEILSSLCLHCNRLNIGKNDIIKDWADVCKAVKTRKDCLHCKIQRPVVRRNGGYIYVTGLPSPSSSSSQSLASALAGGGAMSTTAKQRLLASDAYHNHLCRITDQDRDLITRLHNGIDPRSFLFTVWPVLPNTERPSFDAGDTGDTRSMDKLTFRIANIVELNKALANIINGVTPNPKPNARHDAELLLQDTITLFYTEDHIKGSFLLQKKVTNASLPQSRQGIDEGRPIFSRIQGKEGQLRSGLMGKRVNYTGRTVATGDPTLHLDEVGLPQHFANILTIPVKIWAANIDEWQLKVEQRDKSIRRIVREDGAIIQFQQANKAEDIKLQYGDIVERCLKDGDAVILNRQPTLHRPSFLAMRTKIRPADIKTIGMNVIITKPFNADFDGDELNIHVPQSIESRAELEELMLITWNILTPQAGQPCMNLVQDCMSSIYCMSIDDFIFSKDEAMQMYSSLAPAPPLQSFDTTKQVWLASEMLSWLLPTNFTCSISGKLHFEGGRLLRSTPPVPFTSKEVGTLIHLLCRWPVEGNALSTNASLQQTALFLTYAQRLGLAYFNHRGFSVGIKQCIPSKLQQRDIQAVLEEGLLRAETMAMNYHVKGGITGKRIHEMNMTQCLEATSSSAGAIAHAFIGAEPLSNSIDIMMTSGAKGKINNIMQMSACVGQQIIGGQRPKDAYYGRALPLFNGMETLFDPKARGFIQNSYVAGMNATEFFAAAQGGREGLTDTSIKTQEPGYFTRQLTKNFENLDESHDGFGSVRDDSGNIIQFKYGEDGFDPMCLVKQDMSDLHNSTVGVFLKQGGWLAPGFMTLACSATWTNLARVGFEASAKLINDVPSYAGRLPLDVRHVWQAMFGGHRGGDSNSNSNSNSNNTDTLVGMMLPLIFRGACLFLYRKVRPSLHNKWLEKMVMYIVMRGLQPSFVTPYVAAGRLTPKKIHLFFKTLSVRWARALIRPGEKIGVIAAQSLGQLAMQATLNTFHLSGTGNSAVSTGFPRLRSLVHIAKQEKHDSSLFLYLHPPYNTSEDAAVQIANKLRFTRMVDFVKSIRIRIIKHGDDYEAAAPWLSFWKRINASTLRAKMIDSCRAWPYVIEWEIDKSKLSILQKLCDETSVMQWLANKIRAQFPNVIVVPSPDAIGTLLLFVVDAQPSAADEQPFAVLQRLSINIPETIHVSGVIGIEKIHVSSVKGEFQLECQGGSLAECFELEEVDANRSFCNDPKYMELTYGIEAAQASIMGEINAVLKETAYVDPHHVSAVVDWMGYTGSLRPVNRHTQNKIKTAGVIDRSTNEETIAVLSEGAIQARSDNLLGISGQLATGKLVHAGTGVMQMLIDVEHLTKNP